MEQPHDAAPMPPDPLNRRPIPFWHGTTFLKAVVDHPRIEVGDYTYYDDSRGPEHFVARCVRYHFDFMGDRLVIGKFVAIAQGVQFIMNGANHPMGGISTYPFGSFGFAPGETFGAEYDPPRGDTIIGSDVWIGREAVIMPGVRIGHGAIIGTRAVVTRDVPDYAIVAGNPAREIRRRFAEADIARLLALRWWDWPAEKIMRNVAALRGGDIDALERAT